MTAHVPLRLCVRGTGNGRSGAPKGILLTMPSEFSYIEHAIEVVARHCMAFGVSATAAKFRLRVALCEALSNAIVYGNDMDPAKQVQVTVHVRDAQVEVSVEDEGQGFDPEDVPDPTHDTNLENPRGRGLFLIRQLVDDLTFNDRGNSICMTWHRA